MDLELVNCGHDGSGLQDLFNGLFRGVGQANRTDFACAK
jgi:hypothetical protein